MQPGRGGIGDLQRQIDTIINEIHIAVFEPQANINQGKTFKKLRDQWMNNEASDGFGYAERNLSLRNVLYASPESMACRAASSIIFACSYTIFPVSLNASLRVERCNNWLPVSRSRRETLRLMADGVTPAARAAAESYRDQQSTQKWPDREGVSNSFVFLRQRFIAGQADYLLRDK